MLERAVCSDFAARLHEVEPPCVRSPRAVVAIPARDEEERIEACLSALLAQRREHGAADVGLVLLANNCRDATVRRAWRLLASSDMPHRVLSVSLPSERASAGAARALALDLASLWIGRGEGSLLTTDADSRVGPDWIARNLAGLRGACGAVAGRFVFDPAEAALLPRHLARRRRVEAAYEAALLGLAARLDPQLHDPWPNHWTASGASFALTLSAYRRIGGLPAVACGEDRALAAALARHDIPIRHDPDIVVTTSARLEGRAARGCAATLRERCDDRATPGDERLEALPVALRRMGLRAHLRRAFGTGFRPGEWERRLGLRAGMLSGAASLRFGEAWARVEALSPLLRPQPLRPEEMEHHLAAAHRLLARLPAPGEALARDQQV
ncbi:glycosyltransferase [Ancylobacter mangrovi]|uniref:glycosyltransferase n=1 Tax=Ancylobacter mangrovi TaxID=2972472 RepID=UPI0021636526|nr:glycosyltransferase [Ancylobacter mangrovi]MCS0501255.1 glycosyltransferase [Ancylobacter mangrovi]